MKIKCENENIISIQQTLFHDTDVCVTISHFNIRIIIVFFFFCSKRIII